MLYELKIDSPCEGYMGSIEYSPCASAVIEADEKDQIVKNLPAIVKNIAGFEVTVEEGNQLIIIENKNIHIYGQLILWKNTNLQKFKN